MDVPIKVIKNFISSEETDLLVGYIDFLEKTRFDGFSSYQDGKRLALAFGKDLYHEHSSHVDLSLIAEKREVITELANKAIEYVEKSYDVDGNLYLCSLWFAKQYPGAVVPEHEDTDDGHNTHFAYSAILYLNGLESGGDLLFKDLGHSHKPETGDLVVFPSVGSGLHAVLEIPEVRYSIPMWLTLDSNMNVLSQ
jgi:hypothetical protein